MTLLDLAYTPRQEPRQAPKFEPRRGRRFEEAVARTHRGQAHFADPSLATQCGQCLFWGLPAMHYRRTPSGRPQPRPCAEFKRLTPGVREAALPLIPHDAIACAYFARAPQPDRGRA